MTSDADGIEDLMLTHDLPDYAESYSEHVDDMDAAIDRANVAIGMVQAQSDADWVSHSDALNAAEVYENGMEARIEAHNETHYGVADEERATITFPNNALALVWIEEICGQISDGAWENAGINWQQYYGARVEVDESESGVLLDSRLPNLNYHATLREYEGLVGRMMFHVLAAGVEQDYSREDLVQDLIKLDHPLVSA